MINIQQKTNADGSISVKIGRKSTRLSNGGEVDAFIAGAKIAHIALARKIAPILAVKP